MKNSLTDNDLKFLSRFLLVILILAFLIMFFNSLDHCYYTQVEIQKSKEKVIQMEIEKRKLGLETKSNVTNNQVFPQNNK